MIYDEQRLYLIQERLPEEACFQDMWYRKMNSEATNQLPSPLIK